jgi:hypothetical protein
VIRIATVAMLGLLWCAPSCAADVVPILGGKALGAEIRDLRPPESLRKDLASGLTNRLLIRITLLSRSEAIAQRTVELTVRYDLWDEVFRLGTLMDEATMSATTVKSVAEAMAFLRNVRLAELFARAPPAPAGTLVLEAEILLNPIDRERMAAIKEWVRRNTAPPSPELDGLSGGGATGSGANAIFNRIFEQYATDADFVASWKEALTSQPFAWEPAHDGK